jgi:uncharacterized protein YdhG (YjbR/CyaY superfamily)
MRPPGRRKTEAARPSGVEEYISRAPASAKPLLLELRELVKSADPGLEEGMSYGMPYYKLHGQAVVGFAAYSRHVSLFGSIAGFEDDFRAYETEKGTVKFPLGAPLPSDLIRRYVAARVARARSGT